MRSSVALLERGVWTLLAVGFAFITHATELPVFDFDPEQSHKSREAIESFLAKTGAQLWIQHDYIANSKLRKASDFYD